MKIIMGMVAIMLASPGLAGTDAEALQFATEKTRDMEASVELMKRMIVDMSARIETLERLQEDVVTDDWPDVTTDETVSEEQVTISPPDSNYTNWYTILTGVTNNTALKLVMQAASLEINSGGHWGIYQFEEPTGVERDFTPSNWDIYDETDKTGTLFCVWRRALPGDVPYMQYIEPEFPDVKVNISSNDSPAGGYLGVGGESDKLRLLSTGNEAADGYTAAAGLRYKAYSVGGNAYVALAHDDVVSLSGVQEDGGKVVTSLTLDSMAGNIGADNVSGLGHVTAIGFSDIDDALTNSTYMPPGVNEYDLLRWDGGTNWVLLPNDSDVLKYQVLQKKASGAGGEVGYDWVRVP